MTASGMSDEDIREMARARVSFRIHAMVYVAVNLLLVVIWWLGSGRGPPTLADDSAAYFWPIWSMLGWGIGLAFHGFGAYGSFNKWQRREEEKLRAEHGRQP